MSLKMNFARPTYMGYLAIIRIAVGYHFLTAAWPKVTGPFLQGKQLAADLAKTVVKDPIGLHQSFILHAVIPNSHFFSNLIAFGELAIGLSLIFGCLVRISSAFAAFHNLNILLAVAWANGGPQLAINRLYVVTNLVFVCASAGLALGIDGWLKERFPNSKIF
jgi:thiosulfate dehydrogenase [quinone] large subunit